MNTSILKLHEILLEIQKHLLASLLGTSAHLLIMGGLVQPITWQQ